MTRKPVNILLVEDDEIDAEWIRRGLANNSIVNDVHHAWDGVEALAMLRGDGVPSIQPPYLLLVDINMPRMNGIELIQQLRADPKFSKTVAFILTTSDRSEDKKQAYGLNVAGYIVKSEIGKTFKPMIDMLEHYWKIVELP